MPIFLSHNVAVQAEIFTVPFCVSDSHILLEKACGCHLAKALSFLQLSWPSTLLPSVRQIWLSWRTQWMSGRRWHFQSEFQRRIAEQYDILKLKIVYLKIDINQQPPYCVIIYTLLLKMLCYCCHPPFYHTCFLSF